MADEAEPVPDGHELVSVYASQRRYYHAQVDVVVPAGSDDEAILEAARARVAALPDEAWACADADKVELSIDGAEEDDDGGPDEGGA